MSKTFHTSFPNQMKTINQKTDKWFKECIDAALQYSNVDYNGIRQSYQHKLRNYNLMNDVFDFSNIKHQMTPLLAKSDKYELPVQHYPKIPQKINLLIGEDLSRKFNWTAKVTNDDAISQKEEELDAELDEFFVAQLQKNAKNPEALEKALKEKKHYIDYNYQDKRERMANQILRYYWTYLDMKEMFNRGLEDLLIASEELYRIDILGNAPVIQKVDPLSLSVIGGNNSPWLEDAEIIIQDEYWNKSAIIDAYYDYLKPGEVKKIEEGLTNNSGQSNSTYDTQPEFIVLDELIDTEHYAMSSTSNNNSNSNRHNKLAVNSHGDIRVSRVVWKSRKKVGVLTYFDETSGELQQDMVHESYELDEEKGEVSITYQWINEGLEGTRIGNKENGIYVKLQRIPVESRKSDNISKCNLGYVGVYFNINQSQALSMVDRLYNFQELYNLYMNKLNFLYMKYKGPIYKMDFSTIPNGYSTEEWLYYADVLGWELSNPFNEGNKGASQGKLAGMMNQNQGVKEANLYSIIQQTIDMLNYIEAQIDSISGVSKTREGQIGQRAAVTNTTRELTQSAHITQKWFSVHDQVKRKCLSLFLETAKIALKGQSKKAQHILDDGTIEIINMDGQLLNEAEYDIQITDSIEVQQLMNDLRQFGHAALQNDKITISQLMDLYMFNSISDAKNKLEQGEKEKEVRVQEQRNHEKELQQMQMEAAEMQRKEQTDLELLKQANELQTKILLAQIDINSKQNITDKDRMLEEKLGLLNVEIEKMKIKAIGQRNTTPK